MWAGITIQTSLESRVPVDIMFPDKMSQAYMIKSWLFNGVVLCNLVLLMSSSLDPKKLILCPI